MVAARPCSPAIPASRRLPSASVLMEKVVKFRNGGFRERLRQVVVLVLGLAKDE